MKKSEKSPKDGTTVKYIEEYKPDGSATIHYRDGSLESLDLRLVKWVFASKSAKPYLPAGLEPPPPLP